MDEIQKIVFEIADRCARRKVPVTDMLAAFVAKAVILESPEKFQLDRALSASDVEELVTLAVERLSQEDDPSLETLRMQVSFDSAYVQRQESLEKDRATRKRGYNIIEQSICAMKLQSAKDVGGMGQIHRLIVAALLTQTGQAPQNEIYQKEVAAALESVLPRANLHAFTSLAYADKRARLADLHNYVLGIRLFNKAIGKGGVGLVDKLREANASTQELATKVLEQLQAATRDVEEYEAVIQYVASQQNNPAVADIPLKRLQDELTNRRQYLSFVQSFEVEAMNGREAVMQLAREYEHDMDDLRELVGRRSAVPKERVYPLFEALARRWTEAEEVGMHSAALAQILLELVQFEEPGYKKVLKAEYVEMAGRGGEAEAAPQGGEQEEEKEEEKEEEAPAESKGVSGTELAEALNTESEQPLHVFRNDNPEIISMNVEFSGFCPVTVTERDALLLPADPTNGNVLFKGKLYGFVSMEALLNFLKDPARYLEGVLNQARKAPELINLLSLEQHFPHNVLRKFLANLGAEQTLGMGQMAEAECQTPTHFVEKHIDPKYDFNEWSLRRKAIQLANLHTKVTHSAQTVHSHFRRENETQVYLPKQGVTQTATERGTRPVQHLRYVSGLRGHPDQEMAVVQVDLDLQ
mmetsp:Transcript_58570/g.137604  ORF Transcript_58570/g.137604 Transcript_58570/m.137604 type:complete len:640 (-) Transcript_58570:336-2255(-)